MKITDLKLYHVPHRFLYLKIETDEGVCGWGEPLVEGRAATLEASVLEWCDYLIGQDPLKIEEHWQTMYRCAFYRGGPVMMSTIAGIDQALWDIKGKALGQPVYALINGGVKDKIKVYRGILGVGMTPEEAAAEAKLAKAQGYKLMKSSPMEATHYIDTLASVDLIVRRLAAVRDAVGYDVDVAVDFHGRIHKSMAKVLAQELTQFRLAFIEEPVLPTNNEALREIAKYTATPIATGERMYSRWDYKTLLEQGIVDIIQPDLSHAGGISESLRIAQMAEAYDVAVAPHCPLSAIAFASCIQLDTAVPNAVFQEQAVWIHDCRRENEKLQWLRNPEVFAYKDGFVTPPTLPGLGVEVDEALVAEASRTPHNWKNTRWRTYDGTPIEW